MATYTDSPLATYTNIASSCNHPRNHAIDTITIHCVVGQWTAKKIADYFVANGVKNQNSCNYGVGYDGSISLVVHEEDRSWCSSSATNDHRAITIETASDTTSPYAITDAAYNALIKLCADICQRNGIKKLVWSTSKTKRVNHEDGVNMTCHRDFANKSCPGDYIYEREGDIADAVNAILNGTGSVFTDVTSENLFQTEIEWAAAKGIVQGYSDGTFKPWDNCTRAAFATFLWRLDGSPAVDGDGGFTDTAKIATDFRTAIAWAVDKGVTTGYSDGTFRPWENITRSAIVTMLWRYAGNPDPGDIDVVFTDVDKDDIAIKWAVSRGIIEGYSDGTFRPYDLATRAAVSAFIYRYYIGAVPFLVKVSIDDLNIRSGPGTNYSIVGVTGKGTFTVVDVAGGQGSDEGWGLLKSYQSGRNGWISLDFCKRV